MDATMFLRPEQPPEFPYNSVPYSHIHPTIATGRQHVLFRGHDCWCEPVLNHIKDVHGRKTIAIVVIHNIWTQPNGPGEKKAPYPKLRGDANEL